MSYTDAQLSTGTGPSTISPACPASHLSRDWLQNFIAQVRTLFATFRVDNDRFVALYLILSF